VSINWGQAQPAPLAFWNLAHSYFPVTRNLGIFNSPGHEDHDEGRALDLGLLVVRRNENEIAWGIIDKVLKPNHDEIGWSYFIYDQWIWYPDVRGQNKGGFVGDHTNHIHISWGQTSSQWTNFPKSRVAMSKLLMALTGGIEDDATQTSEVRPYCQ
jgi:hypothetical protein